MTQLPHGTEIVRLLESVNSLFGPLRCWRLALIGAKPVEQIEIRCKSASGDDLRRLVEQAKSAYAREVERAVENRRRSEDHFTRASAALPIVGALLGVLFSATKDWAIGWWLGCVGGLCAIAVFALSLVAISRNLGRTIQMEAVGFHDLIHENEATNSLPDAKLVQEYLTATITNERINNIAITRLHFAHAAFLFAIGPLMLCAATTGLAFGRGALADDEGASPPSHDHAEVPSAPEGDVVPEDAGSPALLDAGMEADAGRALAGAPDDEPPGAHDGAAARDGGREQ